MKVFIFLSILVTFQYGDVILPKVQLSKFPITEEFLQAMTKTISNERKYLLATRGTSSFTNIEIESFLKKNKITYRQLFKEHKSIGSIKKSSLFLIDNKDKDECLSLGRKLNDLGVFVFIGKNLIPYEFLTGSMYLNQYKKEDYLNNEVQDAYLIFKMQEFAYSYQESSFFLENVIENYASILYGRNTQMCSMRDVYDEETGVSEQNTCFSVHYSSIDPCSTDSINEEKPYQFMNSIFYQNFQKNYKKMYGKEFTISNARKKVKIASLTLLDDKEKLYYFNNSFFCSSYRKDELYVQINSKKKKIFCLDSKRDGNKICKTEEEVLKALKKQNSVFRGAKK